MGNEKLVWNCNILKFTVFYSGSHRADILVTWRWSIYRVQLDHQQYRLKVSVPNFSVVYFYGCVSTFRKHTKISWWKCFFISDGKISQSWISSVWKNLYEEILHQLYNVLVISHVLQDFFHQPYLSLATFAVAMVTIASSGLGATAKTYPHFRENGGHIPIISKFTPLLKKDPILPC